MQLTPACLEDVATDRTDTDDLLSCLLSVIYICLLVFFFFFLDGNKKEAGSDILKFLYLIPPLSSLVDILNRGSVAFHSRDS